MYSKLFHLELSKHLPYVTLGLIIWNLINASILEGADVFVANEGLIKQLPTPLSVHVYRLVWRQVILFAHNIVIFMVIAIIFPQPWKWTDLSFIPALALIVLNCVWVALCFGILATRYRDISPLLFSLVQLLFYMTPIIWNDETLRQQGAGGWAKIIEFNPLLHYVDIVRAPLLGRRSGTAALDGGDRADDRRLDRDGVRDAAVPGARAVLGVTGAQSPSKSSSRIVARRTVNSPTIGGFHGSGQRRSSLSHLNRGYQGTAEFLHRRPGR